MSEYVPAASVTDFPSSGKLCLEVADRFVVIVKLEDGFFCVDDVCTHDGGTLGEGELQQNCLVCPRHGAKFDVRTGAAMSMPATEPTVAHEVKIEGDSILVRLAD